MAKDDRAKVKMTVIHFETESDNATLQENIRAIAQTVARALAPPAPRVVHQLQAAPGTIDSNEEATEEDDFIEGDLSSAAKPAKPKGSQKRTYPSVEVIDDLDLTSGPVSFKDFVEDKKVPDNDNRRYLAIALWLKEHRSINEITANHIYTAYKHMGWSAIPKDVAGPLRSMKSKNGWFSKGANKGEYVINHVGEAAFARLTEE